MDRQCIIVLRTEKSLVGLMHRMMGRINIFIHLCVCESRRIPLGVNYCTLDYRRDKQLENKRFEIKRCRTELKGDLLGSLARMKVAYQKWS